MLKPLPIDDVLPELLAALRSNSRGPQSPDRGRKDDPRPARDL